ncbi:hypothetical protein Q8F55_008609 [Vanrija albida]|uniref:Uncharacterized protein n=1 Tax=Vanrija albida TaxID=181172 RepID=A0ABR3PS90_9TREE
MRLLATIITALALFLPALAAVIAERDGPEALEPRRRDKRTYLDRTYFMDCLNRDSTGAVERCYFECQAMARHYPEGGWFEGLNVVLGPDQFMCNRIAEKARRMRKPGEPLRIPDELPVVHIRPEQRRLL